MWFPSILTFDLHICTMLLSSAYLCILLILFVETDLGSESGLGSGHWTGSGLGSGLDSGLDTELASGLDT